ncbi:MAG: ATP synthase F0 subunit B [Desulfatiglans sp.]|jgi:F-type H+-transporting ATPase subunit b|nr:ATP synthase F0 subunit B [Desulfatiglans sp.]
MPEINYTVIIQIVNFILLLVLLNIIVYRPVRGLLIKRKQEEDSSILMTEEWKRKIENYSAEIEEKIDFARKQGIKERISIRDSGLSHEKELVQDASSQVEREIQSARNEIREKIERASASLQGEIDSFSIELAEKLLGRSLV